MSQRRVSRSKGVVCRKQVSIVVRGTVDTVFGSDVPFVRRLSHIARKVATALGNVIFDGLR